MVLLLPLLMAYSLIGETFHEAAGTLMLLLLLCHHRQNRGWWKSLFRGRYTPLRVFQTALNLLLLLLMLLQPLTGILMSKRLFSFLPTTSFSAMARTIHLPLANWGLVLLSLHAGTHLGSMLPKEKGRKPILACMTLAALYGAYAFCKRQIPAYLFLKQAFVFLDHSEPLVLFLADLLAVMILFALLGFGISQGLGRKRKP